MHAKQPPPLAPETFSQENDEIDLRELMAVLWRGKYWIFSITLVSALLATVIALWLPNIYRSEALLAPSTVQKGGALSAMMGQLGGLSNLAGINLGDKEVDKTSITVEVAKSRHFLSTFIRRHQIEVPLMAATRMDEESGNLKIDQSVYDSATKQWQRVVKPGHSVAPTDWELVKKFRELFTIQQDKKSGLVTVSLQFYSPEMAQRWVELLIHDLNQEMKKRDQVEAQQSIDYLKKAQEETSVAEMKKLFSQLIEDQIKTLMLTNVTQEYIFKTLDPAVVAEEKSSPKRGLIILLATMAGGMIGLMLILSRHALRRKVTEHDE